MIRPWALPLLCLLLAALLTGCWDFRDTNERSMVLLLAIDRGVKQHYRVAAQMPVPRTPSGDPSLRGAFRVLEGEGESVEEALEQVRSSIYRYLELSQVKVIVVGPALARAGLRRLDWLWHSRRVPGVAFLAVTGEDIAAVASAKTPALAIPALYSYHQFASTHSLDDRVYPVFRWQAWVKAFSDLEDVALPALTAHRYGLNVAGMGLFRLGRLVGWLSPEETSALNRLHTGRVEGEESVPDPGGRPLAVSLTGGTRRFGVRPEPGGAIVLWTQQTVEGVLREGYPGDLAAAEAQLAARLTRRTRRVLARLQAAGCDAVGFGERLRRLDPAHPAVSSPQAWRSAFRRARVEAGVNLRLRSRGFTR